MNVLKYALGVDIGGTTIATGIVNQNGDLIQRVIDDSDASDREKMFECVVHSIDKLLSHSSIPLEQIYGIGAGVPGKVDRQNGIAVYQTNLPWANFPFVERMQERFQKRVVMDNDVYMAAFAEWKEAKLSDELFVYLTISTGISCSIIQAGEYVRGAGFAGEIGLVPVYAPHDEKKFDRLENVSGGPAIERYGEIELVNEGISSKDVFDAYYQGDRRAERLIDDVVLSIVHGIYMIISILDPHKIVIGGSVAFHNRILLSAIKEELNHYMIDDQNHILDEIEISTQGNEQGIVGAGLRVFDTFSNS